MNTRMLLTAVLRNRRSQWTLLPKEDAAAPAAGGESTAAGPLHPTAEATAGSRSGEPASRTG